MGVKLIILFCAILFGVVECTGPVLVEAVESADATTWPSMKNMVNLVEAALKCGRKIMKKGIGFLNIPVLDPFVLDEYHLKMKNKYIKADFLLNDLSITNISDFVFKKENILNDRLEFNFEVEGSLMADYNGRGLLLGFVDVFGTGQMDITFKLSITGDIYEDDTMNHFYLNQIDSSADVEIEPSIEITAMQGDEHVSFVVGKQLEDIVETIVKDYKQSTLEMILKLVNDFLDAQKPEVKNIKNLTNMINIVCGFI